MAARTSTASLFALAAVLSPAQAQTLLYGEQPPAAPAFPQPQPQQPQFFIEAQPAPTQPLYYESTPAVQPPPPAPFEPEAAPQPPARSFQTIPPETVTTTRPLPPVQRYEPPQTETPPVPTVTESEALRDFSQELARIVSLGERYRAASPGFLEDLKALADKYAEMPVRIKAAAPPAPTPEPQPDLIGPPPPVTLPSAEADPAQTDIALLPTPAPAMVEPQPDPVPEPQEILQALPPTSAAIVYLRDDFGDGDYTVNPTWNVRQGQFTVDPTFGLRPFSPDSAAPAQITPQALLQYLIGDSKPETPAPTGDSGASLIEAPGAIGNTFSLVTTITDHGGEGTAHFIVHQGGANWLGYRLELRAGPRPVVVLARRGASGYKDIMKVEAPGFTTGKPHQLRWARLSDGQMFVLIDGRPIITARDTVFRQGWQGFAYFTADADISMRNIRIAEPVEQ